MPAIVIRKIRAETHRALRARAKRHGRSTEAEVRSILDEAVMPAKKAGLGSALVALAKPLRGLNLKIVRDKTPAVPADLS